MVQFYVLVTVHFRIYSNNHVWESSFQTKLDSQELVTKYTDTLAFNFTQTRIPKWRIMPPLYVIKYA